MKEKISVEAFCNRYGLDKDTRHYLGRFRTMREAWYEADSWALIQGVALQPGVLSDWAYGHLLHRYIHPVWSFLMSWSGAREIIGLPSSLADTPRWLAREYLTCTRMSRKHSAGATRWLRRHARPDFSMAAHTGRYIRSIRRAKFDVESKFSFDLVSYGGVVFEVSENELEEIDVNSLPVLDIVASKKIAPCVGRQYVSMSCESETQG